MSKAFAPESDDADEDDAPPPPPPGGGKHYITPAGFTRLRDEYQQLFAVERPAVVEVVSWAAG
ncbi:MAG: transcription elongation factor GreB, partial [Rhodocyclaceae bacterium]|nr:transcription elongation factor GreB [Rhodocyclaceae bacterium]